MLGTVSNVPNVVLRGGNWNNTSNAGVFTTNLNWNTSNQNNNVGFRCSSGCCPHRTLRTELIYG